MKLLWSFFKINTNLHAFENLYVFNNNNITCTTSSCERVQPKALFKDFGKTFWTLGHRVVTICWKKINSKYNKWWWLNKFQPKKSCKLGKYSVMMSN